MQRVSNTVSNTWTDRLVLLAALCSALAAPLALSGCNTTEGVGKDVSATGDALSDAAEDASD